MLVVFNLNKMKIEDLKNTKIFLRTKEDITRFQKKVFKMGVVWQGRGDTSIDTTHNLYCISNGLRLSFIPNTNFMWFLEKRYKQIFLEDVLSIKESVPVGAPVLVRDRGDQEWEYDVLGRIRSGECKYKCVGGAFYQCIPYEGNEHLLGTSNPA